MKITVAGAGHGGLVAGALLSKNGHDVTVYEKNDRDSLGHDWEDRFTFSLLSDITGEEIPDDSWRYRGDCAFVSPSYRTRVVINYTDENRQKIMQRKTVMKMLLDFAEKCGVKFRFNTEVLSAVTENGAVTGIRTADGEIHSDLVIDAAGVFSPVRTSLPDSFSIEKNPSRGDVFYARRAYYNKTGDAVPDIPFEVFLCHNREQGLSWCCINRDSVDILIGRIDPPGEDLINRHLEKFRKDHPCTGETVIHGGYDGVIPVRRPLSLMVADGYAAVGDSAFMTTPMNGMGIDLSLSAGKLLAETIGASGKADIDTLWKYNRDFHLLYGGITSKNEGLKNALLEMPGEGVDFLFDSAVIQSSDLAGAGSKTSVSSLLGKFVRGMKAPGYFFALLGGLMKGAKMKKAFESAPVKYDRDAVNAWQEAVKSTVLPVTRS